MGILDKAEVTDVRQVTKELHAATSALGRSQRALREAGEAKAHLKKSWLKHLEESVLSWEAQLDQFRATQAQLQDAEAKAAQDLASAQKMINALSAQAKGELNVEMPAVEIVDGQQEDQEAAKLQAKMQGVLANCLQAAGVEIIKIEDSEGENTGETKPKRARDEKDSWRRAMFQSVHGGWSIEGHSK